MLDRLIQLVVDFAQLFFFVTIVHPYQRAVVLRLGLYSRTLKPGWYFHWPFHIEEIIHETVTPRTTNLPIQTIETSDGVQVSVAALVTWDIRNVRKLLLEAAEHQEAMYDTATGLLADAVMSVPYSDIRGREFRETLLSDVKNKAKKWGIRVLDLQLTDLARTRTYRLLSPSAH